ncbi:hypothetical protein [Stenotrophomonas sp. YIM B06876]|uniref:hypothetical protein n=1 Tax=Stenotrophomonas sp. YIM B06876 TaxID=3060211 RepID=UPI002739395C|nr:hypothetical protein [Stenotrophomonas sp. YIM B06876]
MLLVVRATRAMRSSASPGRSGASASLAMRVWCNAFLSVNRRVSTVMEWLLCGINVGVNELYGGTRRRGFGKP